MADINRVKKKRKLVKKMLPVTIHNRKNGREELLQCLVDKEGRFEGFSEVKDVRQTIAWHKRNKHHDLKIMRRPQIVQ